MIFKKIFFASLPILLTIGNVPNIMSQKTVSTLSNDYLQNEIINDIKNYDSINDTTLDTSIVFKQKTLKQLFTLNIETSWKRWENNYTYNYTNQINFDFKNKIAHVNIFPKELSYTFKDPDPKWCDPVGAKWNDKTKKIHIKNGPYELTSQINDLSTWFGKQFSVNFKQDSSNWIDDDIIVSYPNHNYLTHQIRMYISGFYQKQGFNKTVIIKKIDNKNIVKSFLTFTQPKFSNNGLVWDQKSILENNQIFSFSENFKILKTIWYAKYLIKYISNIIDLYTVNNAWINNNISLESLQENIEKLKLLKFKNYNDLVNLKKSLDNNTFYKIDGDYSHKLKELNQSLIDNNLINDEQLITLDNANDFYETIILFFRNNKISVDCYINNIKTNILIWDQDKFCNFFESININNINLLKIDFRSINILYSTKEIQSKEINDNWTINETDYSQDWFNHLSFTILYRYNALNFNSQINQINTNGIILDLNDYVSNIIGTGKLINKVENNKIIDQWKNKILQNLNNIFENKALNIFSNIYSICESNKQRLINCFSLENLRDAANILNINFENNWFNFTPNNYQGVFYAILEIKNWKFIDQTNGDFQASFKQDFIKKINGKYTNIVEIKINNKIRSDSAFFLCKLRTNKVIFEIYNNLVKLAITNNEEITNYISQWTSQVTDISNWTVEKNNSEKRLFLKKIFHHNVKLKNDFYFNPKKVMIKIDLSKNKIPIDKNNNQWIQDLYLHPILNYLKINDLQKENKINFLIKNNDLLIQNNEENKLNINVDLDKFLRFFYVDNLSNNFEYLQQQKNLWDEKIRTFEINHSISYSQFFYWILILLTTIPIIFVLILILVIVKKYKILYKKDYD